jgi:hypothetical protein
MEGNGASFVAAWRLFHWSGVTLSRKIISLLVSHTCENFDGNNTHDLDIPRSRQPERNPLGDNDISFNPWVLNTRATMLTRTPSGASTALFAQGVVWHQYSHMAHVAFKRVRD